MIYTKLKQILIKIPLLVRLYTVFLTGTIFIKPLSQKEKANVIINYAKKFNCKIFVETGTYQGDTVFDCKDFFEKLYSIELSHEFFMRSQKKCRGIDKIKLFEGNSGELLKDIVNEINKPTLYWLDAHYSGGNTARGPEDSPIMKELNSIMNLDTTVCVLIDDARCFSGKNGYPRIRYIKRIIKVKNNFNLEVRNDIIRIVRKKS